MKRNNKTINKPLLTKSRKARYYAEPDKTNKASNIINATTGTLSGLAATGNFISDEMNKVKKIEQAGEQKVDDINQNTESDVKGFTSANSMDSLYDLGSFGMEEKIGYKDLMGGSSALSSTLGGISSIGGLGASAGSFGGGLGAGIGAGVGSLIGGLSGLFSHKKQKDKAKEMADKVNKAVDAANIQKAASYSDAVENLEDKNSLLALMQDAQNNYATGGGIHIKKANRGKFTESAKRAGMGVQEYARHILANKDDYSPTLVKRANFARNAAKWHAEGGSLNSNGANFSNGLTYIDNGGTHEENPLEGVQIGMDNQGIPNLVEEGEVIYNDYVFTNRWKTPKNTKEALGIKKKSSVTYADAAKELSAESKERVNDPITRNTLERNLEILAQSQEADRVKRESRKAKKDFNNLPPEEQLGIMQNVQQYQQEQDMNNQFAIGGQLVRKYEDGDGKLRLIPLSPENIDTAPGIKDPNYLETLFNTVDDRKTFSTTPEYNPLSDLLTINQKAAETVGSTLKVKENPNKNKGGKNLNWARYAPVAGSILSTLNNLLTKPDYSRANALKAEARRVGDWKPVKPTTLTEKATYRPYDPYLDMNRLTAQANANRQALLNQSAGNRATAMQTLQGMNTRTLESLADMRLKADQLNLDRLNKVMEFNRGTSQYNSEAALKAALANEDARFKASSARAGLMDKAFAMQDAIDAQRDTALSSSLSGLFENIGDIGRERDARDMVKFGLETGSFGNVSSDLYNKYFR